jgi:NAD(P)-dependent dehydrogenase (short-subunit alcohol dehydrogenase family)
MSAMGSDTIHHDLEGRTAVVTGGSSGIGAEVVEQLRARGCSVEIADRQSVGGTPVTDVASGSSVAAFARWFGERHDHCDILVNCAGTVAAGTVTEVSEDDWNRVFAVNVTGVWQMCRHIIPLMRPGSSIVNVSSAAALRAIPNMPAYVASKAAVVGLSSAMAIDHAPQGIRVNCVCPGLVDTPMARDAQSIRSAEARESVQNFDNYLIKRYGEAAELAAAIVFLALNEYATGSTLALDGGRSLH